MANNEQQITHMTIGAPITVSKLNPAGEETWRYTGHLLERGANFLTLEAYFDREDVEYHGLFLGKGDRFVEAYYTDRWYNIFEIHARQDDHVRGWYCNIGCPAEIYDDRLSYVDLALDLIVNPNGSQLVLDEDEFEDLDITPETRQQALLALKDLQQFFNRKFQH